jgi:RNA-dependent RNA polymerase
VEGEVMITRNPCLHPGDIKLLRAVNPGDNKFENILNCVVFPKKGKIPITN